MSHQAILDGDFSLKFPDLSRCTQLESVFLDEERWSSLAGYWIPLYAMPTLATISSQILASISFHLTTMEDTEDVTFDSIFGLRDLGELLSCNKRFPALKCLTFDYSCLHTPLKQEVAEAVLEKELGFLTQKRGIEVKCICRNPDFVSARNEVSRLVP
ncbi:hypothetical protein BDY19DRAFT_968671 [Irpex rosettiformis]|uniref:Uncharacterized protein n=1 Tax=Irpex rosettiformis TaxID=378272 RepID=A0ACB8TST2_9APHY|nr:hypothetical protein BDY19DRAFT_968671 [Irpex rosettiformis]